MEEYSSDNNKEKVASSNPGSVGNIAHVHRAYMITQVPLNRVLRVYIWLDNKNCVKKARPVKLV